MTHLFVEHRQVALAYRIVFTTDAITALRDAALHHYDLACRELGTTLTNIAAQAAIGLPAELILDWREFDLLAKVCESGEVPDDVARGVRETFAQLRKDQEALQQIVDSGRLRKE